MDSLPEAIAVKQGSGLRVDSLVIAFGQDYLTLQDIATVALIRDNLGKRPIYFSWSDGNYPDGTLGLTEYLLTTGLVRKLMPKPIQEGNGIVLSKTLGFVDVARDPAVALGDLPLAERDAGAAAGMGGRALLVHPPALRHHLPGDRASS